LRIALHNGDAHRFTGRGIPFLSYRQPGCVPGHLTRDVEVDPEPVALLEVDTLVVVWGILYAGARAAERAVHVGPKMTIHGREVRHLTGVRCDRRQDVVMEGTLVVVDVVDTGTPLEQVVREPEHVV
jgi:hypothetical protein